MNAIECEGVRKSYPDFTLEDIDLTVPEGSVMGLVGPNGAGKSTTIRIIMGLIGHDAGGATVLGHEMPGDQVAAKFDIGFASEDMRLYGHQTLGFHMKLLRSIFPGWDQAYAQDLLRRFELDPDRKLKGMSHGQRVKAALLTVFARRPRLLVLDEPTSGLDPVARRLVLAELMRAMESESRSVLFSSHNTLDVEQISDHITFIDHGRVVASRDKESFLDSWRRLRLVVDPDFALPDGPEFVEAARSGRQLVVTCRDYGAATEARLLSTGATVSQVERMTLEEIFLASVQANRSQSNPSTRDLHGEAA